MTKLRWFQVFAIALSCLFAVALAQFLNLQNAVSAGIIAILSVQATKKRTLNLALERGIFFLIALALAFVFFNLIGYNLWAFSLFVLVFAFVCYWQKGVGSLSICCVLISHFLIKKTMHPAFILNESLLLVIGVGFGILLNLFTPDSVLTIHKQQYTIEEELRSLLTALGDLMEGKEHCSILEPRFQTFESILAVAKTRAEDYSENNLLSAAGSYYILYMHMRENQYQVLLRMFDHAKDLDPSLPQIPLLAAFFRKISASFHESNNAKALLQELETIKAHYKNSPLPITRREFEQRATLYRMLVETEQFLQIKQDFVLSLTKEQRKTFLLNTGQS